MRENITMEMTEVLFDDYLKSKYPGASQDQLEFIKNIYKRREENGNK